jgi:hypothetical protein
MSAGECHGSSWDQQFAAALLVLPLQLARHGNWGKCASVVRGTFCLNLAFSSDKKIQIRLSLTQVL